MKRVPDMPWLIPAEQEEVCQLLLEYELLKFSNERDLPLKNGETTDIYINLRDARNHPEAIGYIARLFENPLRRLGVSRFAEVPDAVSCFAGVLSERTGIPYLTIREQPKEGRVAKASVIGSPKKGERMCILDDVITDGASKIQPYRECVKMGLRPDTLAVLVDRQQGWQKKFAEENIHMSVWPGMTLHDVRYHLIRTFGAMKRCDGQLEEKNPIIVALDGKSWEEILPIVDPLRTTGCILKVNDLLFDKGIEWLVPNLSVYGRVMVDLKGHDIPNTLENVAKRLRKNPPWAVTVHASAGEEGIRALVKALEGTRIMVLAVTVLTSFDEKTCEEIYSRKPLDQVRALEAVAAKAGVHGFVCSPEEVSELRSFGKILVTPGVRSPGADKGDQKRVDTPHAAVERGANYLVMGRQIVGAPDPVAEVRRVLTDELGISI